MCKLSPPGLRAVIAATLVSLVSFCNLATAGTVDRHVLHSALLGRDYAYTVYMPDAAARQGLRFPVLYLLHGANGDEYDWPVKGKVAPTLDRLIAEGQIPPMIVIMPGHKNMWWLDGSAEPAESVLLTELMPEVERTLPAQRRREGRAIAGLSAGGHAAVRLSFKWPELFAAAAGLSPAVYDPVPPGNSSAMKDANLQKDGKFDPDLWRRMNWQPLFDGYKAKGIIVPIYLNTGDHDRFGIPLHAARLYDALWRHQPEQTRFRVYDGDHEWSFWERTIGEALVFMAPYLARPQPEPTIRTQ